MSATELGFALALGFALLVVVQTLRLWLARSAPARRLAALRARGQAGERAAIGLLERSGYRIDQVQPTLSWTIHCDGEPVPVELRADLLVSRDSRRFVAEIKTGARAPQLHTAGTRRQLLEYTVAYAADGVLLVDMESERIHEVSFPELRAGQRGGSIAGYWIVVLLLVALSWWLVTVNGVG